MARKNQHGGNRNGSGRPVGKKKKKNQKIQVSVGRPNGSFTVNHFNQDDQLTIVKFTPEEEKRILMKGTPLDLSEWDQARLNISPVLIRELWLEKWKRERNIQGAEIVEKKFENLMMDIYEFVESKGMVAECDQWLRRSQR